MSDAGAPAGAKRPLGIGLIGLGMGVKPHAASLRDLEAAGEVKVVGAYARTAPARAEFCSTWNFPEAASLEALRDDPELDAVMLITPPNARVDLVEMFAGAGKAILMEKPVERTTEASVRIVETCEKAGVPLGIVLQHRFREGPHKLRRLMDSGALGKLAVANLYMPWWRPQSYYNELGRGTLERDGGGVLLSQAIHSMELMLSLTGPVAEVQSVAATTALHKMETEDFVAAGLRYANGAVGSLMTTTASFPGGSDFMMLEFEKASAVLERASLTVSWHDGRVDKTEEESGSGGGGADPMAFPYHWHMALIEDFVTAVRTGSPPRIPGREALRVHRLIDALLASSAERRAVAVEKIEE